MKTRPDSHKNVASNTTPAPTAATTTTTTTTTTTSAVLLLLLLLLLLQCSCGCSCCCCCCTSSTSRRSLSLLLLFDDPKPLHLSHKPKYPSIHSSTKNAGSYIAACLLQTGILGGGFAPAQRRRMQLASGSRVGRPFGLLFEVWVWWVYAVVPRCRTGVPFQ